MVSQTTKTPLLYTDAVAGSRAGSQVAPKQTTQSSITNTVIGLIRDADHRKRNVIISGLPEGASSRDITKVQQLINDHVKCPTVVNIVSCSRLCKAGLYRGSGRCWLD